MLTSFFLLFATAFLAATLLPLSSELLLASLLQSPAQAVALVLVATAGNVLGSCLNRWMGLYLLQFRDRRWFYFSESSIQQAQDRFNRYGYWSLLLAWVPLIGDPLTLLAGVMRVPLGRFVVLVTVGKAGRYAFVAWVTLVLHAPS